MTTAIPTLSPIATRARPLDTRLWDILRKPVVTAEDQAYLDSRECDDIRRATQGDE